MRQVLIYSGKEKAMSDHKHLSFSDRQIIEKGIVNNSDKTSIARLLNKDPSTIGKEIRLHRKKYHNWPLPLECTAYARCKYGRACRKSCQGYVPFICKRRDRSPGACNGCEKAKNCRYDKYRYDAQGANHEYLLSLKETRQGFNITKEEVVRIGRLIQPLIRNGQSLYVILTNHYNEIRLSEKTLYTYIESGLFKSAGIDLGQMDLIRQVNRKLPKEKACLYKPRNDYSYLKGRLYEDYLSYVEVNKNARIVQMDTVYNDISKGPFIQTFKFLRYGFLFGVYHKEKTAQQMNEGVLLLESILGEELFEKEAEVLLTDRGSEFYGLPEIESRKDGSLRTRIFYCDPMASRQKGSLENKHIEMRYILPKETDLSALGLNSQEDMNLVISHVNSAPKEKLNGRTPFELMEFLQPGLYQKFIDYGLVAVDKDSVILKPYLLKK